MIVIPVVVMGFRAAKAPPAVALVACPNCERVVDGQVVRVPLARGFCATCGRSARPT